MVKFLLFSLLALIVSCTCCYSPKYTYRVLVWQDSDYNDGEKFKYTTINKSDDPFKFHETNERQSVKEISDLASYVENDDFIQFLQERGTYSFLVVRNDTILIEKYFGDNNRETLQNTFSVSKSILGLAVAKAIELGYLNGTNEQITKYIPELLKRDEDFSKITIGDLLKMKSGIKYSSKTSFPWLNKDNVLTYYHPDLRKVALRNTKIDRQADEEFLYNNYNPLLLGLIMERATKMKLSKFVEQYIWKKIGTEFNARWSTDENEFEKMESGFMSTPIDMAKIGRLVLKNGNYNGAQILSHELLSEFTKQESKLEVFENRYWGYGHLWWSLPDETENPSIMANGHMGQFIFINPKTNYIIVRNGLKMGQFYDDDWTEIFNSYTKSKIDIN